jgi:hypothetical protein
MLTGKKGQFSGIFLHESGGWHSNPEPGRHLEGKLLIQMYLPAESRRLNSAMEELLIRFLIGGTVVSSFALLGEVFRPKTFAGLFGAAPSIALASLGLTIVHHGHAYAAVEARSMLLGAIAFFLYASSVSWLLLRHKTHSLVTTLALMPVWFGVALGLYALLVRWPA